MNISSFFFCCPFNNRTYGLTPLSYPKFTNSNGKICWRINRNTSAKCQLKLNYLINWHYVILISWILFFFLFLSFNIHLKQNINCTSRWWTIQRNVLFAMIDFSLIVILFQFFQIFFFVLNLDCGFDWSFL